MRLNEKTLIYDFAQAALINIFLSTIQGQLHLTRTIPCRGGFFRGVEFPSIVFGALSLKSSSLALPLPYQNGEQSERIDPTILHFMQV